MLTFEEIAGEALKGELEGVDEAIRLALHSSDGVFGRMTGHVEKSGGKRLRPALLLLASRVFKHDPARAIPLSAAVELLHWATLIHDDVIDDAELRRGRPSVNAMWGNKASIIYGDFLFSTAIGLVLRDGDVGIHRLLAKTIQKIIEGQGRQMSRRKDAGLRPADYLEIAGLKTAELFAAACRVGAIVGGAGDGEMRRLDGFGRNLGLAFQLVDDALDFTSSEDELGKPVVKDIVNGDVTLPVLLLIERAVPEDARFVENLITDGLPDEGKLRRLLALVRRYGTAERTVEIAWEKAGVAEREIASLGGGEAADSLLKVLKFAVDRRS